MKEEEALSHSPERSGAELIGAGRSLRYTVGESCSHVVHGEVGEWVIGLIAHACED